jgi:hypothetical protein
MKTYRIYTEDKNKDKVIKLVSKTFDGFTVTNGQGYWKGVPEKALIIEIVEKRYSSGQVNNLCIEIKKLNKQQAILLTETKTSRHII